MSALDWTDREPPSLSDHIREQVRRGRLGSCECGQFCGYCGEREVDHVGETKQCPNCDPEDVFCDPWTPDTYYVETHRQTHWSPAEGVEVCEKCNRERE